MVFLVFALVCAAFLVTGLFGVITAVIGMTFWGAVVLVAHVSSELKRDEPTQVKRVVVLEDVGGDERFHLINIK